MAEIVNKTKAQILSDLEFAICGNELEIGFTDDQPSVDWYQQIWQHIYPKLRHSLLPEYKVPARLGLYFEWLWQLALKQHSDYRVLATNLQINDGSRTLGSFDFLIEHTPSGKIEHWELACKFYLAVEWQKQWLWLGPNLNDCWLLKKEKLLDHQIRLSDTPCAQIKLAELGIPLPQHKRIIVKGKVFWPNRKAAQTHYWQTYNHWLQTSRQGQIQPKTTWLSCQARSSDMLSKEIEPNQPIMLLTKHGQSFVVPNEWPQRAQKKAAELLR